LRAKQYIIPNYPLPPNEDKIEILRVVVRESMSFDLLDRLITDICQTTQDLIVSSFLLLFSPYHLPLKIAGVCRVCMVIVVKMEGDDGTRLTRNRTTTNPTSRSWARAKIPAPRNSILALASTLEASRKEGEGRGP
jgi:hypothetical protein